MVVGSLWGRGLGELPSCLCVATTVITRDLLGVFVRLQASSGWMIIQHWIISDLARLFEALLGQRNKAFSR